ncbi:MAG: ROK family protein [Proteobacteria bacterium]|nr:ROK family protein [Pseudomonadota bacterium]MDA1059019.1 ROK family protein [Pseudomonadota bacterium]
MPTDRRCRIGIDLGGTKIEGVALDPSGLEATRLRVPAPRDDYHATISTIANLVQRLSDAAPCVDPVGIGIPGAISPVTGLVKNANSTWLIGHALDRDLELALGRPVRLANDANCFALSESIDGAAAGIDCVFGVILGTGVGSGIVVDGRVMNGRNAIAGEWGHGPLPWPTEDEMPGTVCYCGKRGCVETFLSGPGLAAHHHAATQIVLDAEGIVAGAEQGEASCVRSLDRYTEQLAKALANVVNVLDPDVIVLGGGLSNIETLYRDVPTRWERYVFSDEISTPLVKARHGDSSGVRGAARLWPLAVAAAR